jgi:cytochrome c biogenesis protein ResB
VELEWENGFRDQRFVFPPNIPHRAQTDGFVFIYMFVKPQRREVKDYYSDVTVLDYAHTTEHRQIIEVNHPLHYGGYHFYQNKGDEPEVLVTAGEQRILKPVGYTVLEVVSDTGLNVVYLGFWLLSAGIFWQCWLRHIIRYLGNRSQNGNQV